MQSWASNKITSDFELCAFLWLSFTELFGEYVEQVRIRETSYQ